MKTVPIFSWLRPIVIKPPSFNSWFLLFDLNTHVTSYLSCFSLVLAKTHKNLTYTFAGQNTQALLSSAGQNALASYRQGYGARAGAQAGHRALGPPVLWRLTKLLIINLNYYLQGMKNTEKMDINRLLIMRFHIWIYTLEEICVDDHIQNAMNYH